MHRKIWRIITSVLIMLLGAIPAGVAAAKPSGGVWSGVNISFFVADDGSKITWEHSKLKGRAAVLLVMQSDRFSVRISSLVNIPIVDGRFKYETAKPKKEDNIFLEGEFISATEARGTAAYRKGSTHTETDWTATYQPDAPDANPPARVISASQQYPKPESIPPAVQTLSGHTSLVLNMAFTADFKTMATGSNDKTVRLWDLEKGVLLYTLKGHADAVRAVAFSPDGQRIYSASDDETIRTWEVKTGSLLATLSERVWSFVVTPDGGQLIAGTSDGCVRFWDLATLEAVRTIEVGTAGIISMVLTSDAKRLVAGIYDGGIKAYDPATGRELWSIAAHDNNLGTLILTPDEKRIVSCSWDRTIKVWDLQTGDLVQTLAEGHTKSVVATAVSPDGKYLVSSGWDSALNVWDLEKGTLRKTYLCEDEGICDLRFTPDGTQLIGGMPDGSIRFWSWQSMQ